MPTAAKAPGSNAPLQARHLPHPSADPYSVPGMIARLTETATPHEVAGIIEEVNGALVGALPQLTELVAVAEDMIAACPAELSDSKYRDDCPAGQGADQRCPRQRAVADTKPPAAQNPEADRRRAARASSPHAATQRTTPSAGATSEPPASARPPRSPRTR
ncbi:hypothetical protein [Streptomyces sp. NPDC056291]|uniref:hypothetical protein n=1 Tax=Streptomyces sp. NPDC056291 TaxID=3345772 RepID=UPI0035E10B3F